MKMVLRNAVFIREKAKHARNAHRYTISTGNFTSFNSVNFPEHRANYIHHGLQEIICSHDYDVMLGDFTHKSWYLHGAESFTFSQPLARNKKSSTI